MKYAKGIMWLDDCRIPFVDERDGYTDEEWKNLYAGNRTDSITNIGNEVKNIKRELLPKAPQGRFTPNLLVCDDMLNDGNKSQYGKKINYNNTTFKEALYGFKCKAEAPFMYGDKGTNSRYYDLDKWFEKLINEL